MRAAVVGTPAAAIREVAAATPAAEGWGVVEWAAATPAAEGRGRGGMGGGGMGRGGMGNPSAAVSNQEWEQLATNPKGQARAHHHRVPEIALH